VSVLATFRLSGYEDYKRAVVGVNSAPMGMVVTIAEPVRNKDQNARLHALLADLVTARPVWAGERMGIEDWKALMVHGVDVHEGRTAGRAVPGVEGGVVLLRRQTRTMSKKDLSELIEYIEATMVKWGIPVKDTRHAA
jgi:hypothetical protein